MSQRDRILAYLQSGKELTRLNAWDQVGSIEAPARISELRQQGYNIITTMIKVKNRYGETVRVAKWRLIENCEVNISEFVSGLKACENGDVCPGGAHPCFERGYKAQKKLIKVKP